LVPNILSTPDWSLSGGDVDLDGNADLLVGYLFTNKSGGIGATLFPGSKSGLGSVSPLTLTHNASDMAFGRSVAASASGS
jgi:hypothetical protein